jgi:hypothetical protein
LQKDPRSRGRNAVTADKAAAPGQWANRQRIWQEKEDRKERKKTTGSQQMTQGNPESSQDFPVDGDEAQERRSRMNDKDKPEGERKG